jgi:hypothetical protein
MRTANVFRCLVALALLSAAGERCIAEESKTPTQEELIKNLEKTLTGAKLTGRFTVTGKEDMAPAPEEYTITSARKLIDGDQWMITARIKYGKTDKSFPVPIDIKWAGTWQHDAVGGHLYGTISRATEQPNEEESK